VELPHIRDVYNSLTEEYPDVQVIAVEINDDREGAEAFIEENNLDFIFSEADRDFVKEKFNTAGYPNNFIIDRDKTIKMHKLGFRPGDEKVIKEELLTLLKQ
jgi:hypothetical protein